MVKKSKILRRKHHRKSRHHSRRRKYHRGGANAPNPSQYSSASTYMESAVGSMKTQLNNVFGQNNNSQSNEIRGLQGQIGGKKNKTKRGGYWGQVVNQAVVPFALWGMQNRYNRHKRNKTCKR